MNTLHNNACIKIQSRFRGYKARKDLSKQNLKETNHISLNQNKEKLGKAVSALGRFTVDYTNCESISKIDSAFDTLIVLLYSNSDSVKANAAFQLGRLTLKQINSHKLAQTLEPLISFLTHESEEIKVNAALALANLAHYIEISDENSTQVNQMVKSLFQLSNQSEWIKSITVRTLANLTYNKKNIEVISTNHSACFKLFTNLLTYKSYSIKANAALALGNLALNESNRQIIGQVESVFEDLSTLLSNESEPVKRYATFALGNLALNESNRRIIGQVDTIFESLTTLLSNESDAIKVNAALALANLALDESNRQTIGQVKSIFEKLTTLLSNESELVKHYATFALDKLAINQTNKELIMKAIILSIFRACINWIWNSFMLYLQNIKKY
ncbi:MAG: IQ calmodulin-binding motif-containing protein [Candidatus Margulisiibacteriota bacterium]|nr:IQ calmodulin-binding motif-containing protein [Candidatus Margulisiibacteriota bacterium]